ncbi:protein LNK1 [Cinnamomum micranthum f. kanehirae]|uniref:Protein LNK1 n=1 Tax=Cinnamomum micranthum f. kanehirae TaxID=337451 RepID=A0A443PQK4_9MAGN|nr:protein LNK1 [Cinnamomum micranthum f. kanehirae]
MSDWGMYELEDIIWDEFGGSDDHIVPHRGRTTSSDCVHKSDFHKKKPRGEAASSVGWSTDSGTSVDKNVLQGKEKTTFHSTLEGGRAPMLEKGSWSHSHDNVFPASCDSGSINLPTGLASEDAKISNNCFKGSNVDSVGNEFCTGDPIVGNGGDAAVGNNLCDFQLDDISATESDLEFFRNGTDQKENSDLLDYGWPDIGNFEDIDRMFRNCDSTFGQSNASAGNDLSWFSTLSHANDCSEETPKSGFSSEGKVFTNTPEHHETDAKSMPASNHLPITERDKRKGSGTFTKSSWNQDANDHCPYANWFNGETENKGESASVDQAQEANGFDEVKISPETPISNESSITGCQASDLENTQRKQSKSRDQLEGKRKVHSSKYLNGSLQGSCSAHQFKDLKLPSSVPYSSQIFSQRRQLWEANSSRYLRAYVPYGHHEYGHPSHQFSITPAVSSIKSETKNHPLSRKVLEHDASNNVPPVEMSTNPPSKLSTVTPEEKVKTLHSQQVRATMSNEHQHDQFMSDAVFTDQAPVQKQLHQFQNEVGGDGELEEAGMEFVATEIDSTIQESSCMSSVLSNEISLEATSFRRLQDVMEQLDIRTKLCIRDSLYRLARSAEQRHNFCLANTNSRDKRGRSGTPAEEESSKHDQSQCLEYMDPETDTNPIDRSIAHLLFYRPSGPLTRLSNDALSLESPVIIHSSTTNQSVMHDQLVCHEDIGGDADMKLPITEQ